MTDELPASIVEAHQGFNRSTLAARERYAAHRRHVMALLPAREPERGGRALVLGAGNCNDFELDELLRRYDAVTLVDIDPDACTAAVEGLEPALRTRVRVVSHDVSGVLPRLGAWARTPPTAEELRALPARASAELGAVLDETYALVLSSGVLSQLVWSAKQTLGVGHPALGPAAITATVTHVQLAVDRLAAEGTLVLAVDTVARKPGELEQMVTPAGLPALLLQLERARRCLPATEPSLLLGAIGRAAPQARVTVAAPWLWTVAEHRTSLVYGVTVQRPPAAPGCATPP